MASRFQEGQLAWDDTVAYASGDLAYTVGFERGEVVVEGGVCRPMAIRVSHIYRCIEGDWLLVHRHADFPLEDQRNAGQQLLLRQYPSLKKGIRQQHH